MSTCWEVASYIRGYHAYQAIWPANIGDVLSLKREPDNIQDPEAVAVLSFDHEIVTNGLAAGLKSMDNGMIVGHVPKLITKYISRYLKRATNSGDIVVKAAKVNRGAGYGLEIPCLLRFTGDDFSVNWLKEKLNSSQQY